MYFIIEERIMKIHKLIHIFIKYKLVYCTLLIYFKHKTKNFGLILFIF